MHRWVRAIQALTIGLLTPGLRWFDLLIAPAGAIWAWALLDRETGDLPLLSFGPDTSNWIEAAIAIRNLDLDTLASTGRPILYPLLFAARLHSGQDLLALGMTLSTLAWMLTPAVGYLAGAHIGGRIAGVVTASLLVSSTALAEPAMMVNSQSVFNLLLVGWIGVGAGWMARAGRGDALRLGLGAGILLLTKEQGLLVAAFTGIALVLRVGARIIRGARRRGVVRGAAEILGVALVFLAGFFVAISPQLALVVVELNSLHRLPKLLLPASDFLSSHRLPNPMAGLPGAGTPPTETIVGGLQDKLIGQTAAQELYRTLGYLPQLAAVGLALGLLRAKARLAWITLHLLPLGPALALGFFYPYHVSFLVIPLALSAAVGATSCLPDPASAMTVWAAGGSWRRGVLVAQLAVGLFVLGDGVLWIEAQERTQAAARVHRLSRAMDQQKITRWAEAADWMRINLPPGFRLLSVEPAIARSCGGVPIDSGLTPVAAGTAPRPAEIAACDLYAAYGADEYNGLWISHRVGPPDFLPAGATLVWVGAGTPSMAVRVVRWAGTSPDDPSCSADTSTTSGFSPPMLAPPPLPPAAQPPLQPVTPALLQPVDPGHPARGPARAPPPP